MAHLIGESNEHKRRRGRKFRLITHEKGYRKEGNRGRGGAVIEILSSIRFVNRRNEFCYIRSDKKDPEKERQEDLKWREGATGQQKGGSVKEKGLMG